MHSLVLRGSLAGLLTGVLAIAASALPAQASAGYSAAPAVRLPQSCTSVVPTKALESLFGSSRWTRTRLNAPILAREAGEWACDSTDGIDGSVSVVAIASGDKGFAAERKRLIQSAGSDAEIGKTRVIECSFDDSIDYSYSCEIDLLVHHVWAEAGMSIAALTTDDPGPYAHAKVIAAALQKGFRHGAKGHLWKVPKSAWTPPSTCSKFDPKAAVGSAAGLAGATTQPGEDGTDSWVGALAERRVHVLKCSWWNADFSRSVTATIHPGASWVHVAGKKTATRTIGHGAKHVGIRSDAGSWTVDVTAKGGTVEVELPSGTRAQAIRATKAVLARL